MFFDIFVSCNYQHSFKLENAIKEFNIHHRELGRDWYLYILTIEILSHEGVKADIVAENKSAT